jgi:hypothetical protein
MQAKSVKERNIEVWELPQPIKLLQGAKFSIMSNGTKRKKNGQMLGK